MTTYRPFRFGQLPPLVIVVPIAIVQVVFTFGAAYGQGVIDRVNALTVVLALALAGMLTWRRSHPLVVLPVVYALLTAYFALGFPYGPVFISLVVALFNAVANGPRWPAWATGYAGTVVLYVVMVVAKHGFDWGSAGAVLAWASLVMGLGELAKARRDRMAQAAATQAEQDRRQASEERLRIAREVHDVLAHHVSLINVQSGVALHLIDSQPEQVREALTAIKSSSKEVLVELRNILGVLRDVDGNGAAPRHPVASLDQLDPLLERMRSAGLPVSLEVKGDQRPLPKGVDAAALRILQESLTNTYRHAGPTSATVTLSYLPDELRVQVDDEGRGKAGGASEGTGSGLTGMRQRAEALGGTFEAGPRPGGGFRVVATFPTGGDE